METSADDPPQSFHIPPRKPEPPSQTGRPLTQFTLFPKLIIELRLKTWAFCFALQEPRLVEVRTQHHDCDQHKGWCPRFAACRIPTLVHTCHEARMVAREQAQRAGHLCFSTLCSPPNIFFNPEIDRLYLPVEKEPWMRDVDEPYARARTRRHGLPVSYRQNMGMAHWPAQPPVAGDGPQSAPVSTTTLSQFKKCHKPATVRFLVSDLEIRPHFLPQDPVWTVMQEFLNLEELIFLVPEHRLAYADLIEELERTAQMVGQERERWSNAFGEGAVSWKWPDVRLALRCKGDLKFVELEGRHD
jgi:hypothetical protein